MQVFLNKREMKIRYGAISLCCGLDLGENNGSTYQRRRSSGVSSSFVGGVSLSPVFTRICAFAYGCDVTRTQICLSRLLCSGLEANRWKFACIRRDMAGLNISMQI